MKLAQQSKELKRFGTIAGAGFALRIMRGEPWSVIQLPLAGVAPINFWRARNKTLRPDWQPLSPSAGDHNLLFGKE
jgi:hypothetical protein